MTAVPRAGNSWLNAFLFICSAVFAPYFWLIEEIIKRRRRRGK